MSSRPEKINFDPNKSFQAAFLESAERFLSLDSIDSMKQLKALIESVNQTDNYPELSDLFTKIQALVNLDNDGDEKKQLKLDCVSIIHNKSQ